jgi:tetratricopeptide (TPR) repeat protein
VVQGLKYLLHDFQGSLHDLDKAHALQPQDPYILKERVALKVMMKDYQGAMGDLERAHQLDRDEFTHEMRRGVRQNSQQYLKAMASLLQKVL